MYQILTIALQGLKGLNDLLFAPDPIDERIRAEQTRLWAIYSLWHKN